MKVVHYLNQFFAGQGGEAAAQQPPARHEGPLGPGRLLQQQLGGGAEVVASVVCGDDYFAEREEAAAQVLDLILGCGADAVVAGPAFNAGRYGMACGRVCRDAAEAGLVAVAGMHPDNPAAELFRRDTYIVRTADSTAGMGEAVASLARLTLALGRGERPSPEAAGFLPRGRRHNAFVERTGAQRAVAMLLDRVRGVVRTEVELPRYQRVPPAAAVADLRRACIAFATTGGLVPRGNPDRLELARATKVLRYPLDLERGLAPEAYEVAHSGYDNDEVLADPRRLVPTDAASEALRQGWVAEVYPWYYVTAGMATAIQNAEGFGAAMAQRLLADGVQGVILTST